MPLSYRPSPRPSSRRAPLPQAVAERLRQQGVIAMPVTEDTRILLIDLIIAARALHEFRVVAAGSMYATLALTSEQRRRLTEARVAWMLD